MRTPCRCDAVLSARLGRTRCLPIRAQAAPATRFDLSAPCSEVFRSDKLRPPQCSESPRVEQLIWSGTISRASSKLARAKIGSPRARMTQRHSSSGRDQCSERSGHRICPIPCARFALGIAIFHEISGYFFGSGRQDTLAPFVAYLAEGRE